MAYPIERGVPLPKKGRPGKYPFRTMAVGDSFWAPVQPATLRACAQRAKVPGARFTTRREVRGGVTGTGCWRVT